MISYSFIDVYFYRNGSSFNAKNGTNLVSVGAIHYEPFGIYGNGVTDLKDLAKGATIIIPADDSNETRALFLLQQEGLIKLPDDADAAKGVSTLDIVDDGGYNVTPVQADTVPSVLANSDAGTIAVINGNFAIGAGLSPAEDALFLEPADGETGITYTNYIVVRTEDAEADFVAALRKVLYTQKVKDFILNYEDFKGGVIPTFEIAE